MTRHGASLPRGRRRSVHARRRLPRRGPRVRSCGAFRLRLPARDRRGPSPARSPTRCRTGTAKGAVVERPVRRRAPPRRRRPRSRSSAPPGIEPRRSSALVDELPPALVDLALWLADYYGSTPARALALVAPRAPKRRAAGARLRPLGESLERRGGAGPRSRTSSGRRSRGSWRRSTRAPAARPARGRRPAAARPRSTSRPARRRSSAGSARSCSCRRSRSRRRPSAAFRRPLRRPRRDPPLGARRGRAARRARADRERRGAHRRRRALGGLRADARRRPDRRRRGARRLVQAGVRPALRRAHGRREAGRARGRGRRLRLGDAAARELGALERLGSPARIGAPMPPVRVVDLRREAGYPLSAPLLEELGGLVDRGGKAILLLNRRGVAPAVHCRACGATRRCPNCDVALTLHRDGALRCHHCGRSEPVPDVVPGVRLERGRPDRRRHAAARGGAREATARARADPPRRRRRQRPERSGRRSSGSAPPSGPCCSARRWSRRATTSPASSSRP